MTGVAGRTSNERAVRASASARMPSMSRHDLARGLPRCSGSSSRAPSRSLALLDRALRKPKRAKQSVHLGFDARHFGEADRVDLLGR